MKLTRKPSVISAPSIGDIDAENTPSLKGFWKCDETSGSTIIDYSGNGYDLTIDVDPTPWVSIDKWLPNQITTVAETHTHKPGWFTLAKQVNALIDATGTGLTHSNKITLLSCELYTAHDISDEVQFDDCDLGSAWDFTEATDTYKGFMIGSAITGTQGAFGRVWVNDPTYTQGGDPVPVAVETAFSMTAGFVPSDRVTQSINGGALTSNVTAIASVDNQGGKFGFGSSASRERVSVRNYQIWTFDTEPSDFDVTIQWLSANPGKIPPWWVGK